MIQGLIIASFVLDNSSPLLPSFNTIAGDFHGLRGVYQQSLNPYLFNNQLLVELIRVLEHPAPKKKKQSLEEFLCCYCNFYYIEKYQGWGDTSASYFHSIKISARIYNPQYFFKKNYKTSLRMFFSLYILYQK